MSSFEWPDKSEGTDGPRRRVWPWVFLGVGVVVLVAAAVPARRQLLRQAARERVREALAELDAADPRWRLADIEADRPKVPDAENSARVVVAVAGLLPRNWPEAAFVDAFGEPEPPELLSKDDYARLRAELTKLAPALREAGRLADLPRGRYPITYRKEVFATLLTDQQKARPVDALLRSDAWVRAQDGDAAGALVSCRGILNAARSLGDEPLAVSQLIRNAGAAVACQTAERVLALGEPGPEELARLQRLLEDEGRFPAALVLARGERAAWQEFFDGVETGEISAEEGPADRRPLAGRLFGRSQRDRLREEHQRALRLLTRLVEAARRPPHEQLPAVRAAAADEATDGTGREGSVTAGFLLSSVERVLESVRRKQAQVGCAATALAAERYRRARGGWPDSLQKLVPDFLDAVPRDPYDGAPLRYRRLDDGLVVYSVGPDGTDDGGTIDRDDPQRPGADLGFRLWDVAHRRQPPPKAPPPADDPE